MAPNVVGFAVRDGSTLALKRVSLSGGDVRTVYTGEGRLNGAMWRRDDTIVFAGRGTGLTEVSAGGSGVARALTTVSEHELGHTSPRGLPGRDEILFTILPKALNDRQIRSGAQLAVFSPDTGDVRPLLEEPLSLGPDVYRIVRISPDGRRVALDRATEDGTRDVWVLDLARDTLSPVTRDPADDSFPLWTPNGQRIVFGSTRQGAHNLFWRSADGTGPVTQLSDGDVGLRWPYSWSPDGQSLAFVYQEPGMTQSFDVRLLAAGSDGAVRPLLDTEFRESNPAISPNGAWIAYRSDESGRDEIYVQRFPELGTRIPISTEGGEAPPWSRDGTELYCRNGDAMMAVAVGSGTELDVGLPELLFEGRYLNDRARNYDIGPDGRFLMIRMGDSSVLGQIHVVVNWFTELEETLGITRPSVDPVLRDMALLRALFARRGGSGAAPPVVPRRRGDQWLQQSHGSGR